MALSFNPATNDFVVTTRDTERAENTGLTLSTRVRGPAGEPMYFTKDPYAALEFYAEGNEIARRKLAGMMSDYEASWATECGIAYPVGPNAPFQPRPYQNAGVDYCLRRQRRLIGDEPGLGKTLQSIVLNNVEGSGRNLIICPARVRKQWRDQIKMWTVIPNVRTYLIEKGSDGVATWPHYTIISYELARNKEIHAALRAIKWDSLTIDEGHFLKSIGALRTRAVFGGGRDMDYKEALADKAKHVTVLTGTPLPNRPRECYTLARALQWESIDWLGEDDFRFRFNPSARITIKVRSVDPMTGEVTERDQIVNKEDKGRLPELQARLRTNFMVRRLKADVLKDLPDKQYEFAYIETDGTIADILRREKMLDYKVDDLKGPYNFQIDGQISTLRREMGTAKIPQAIEHMRYLLDVVGLEKVVMFSYHRGVMDALNEALKDYGVVEVRGGTSAHQSAKAVELFRFNPKVKIFSGQLDAAGFGIDGLQDAAFHVVFIEPSWTPGNNEQAVDRLHRLGQHANVIAQFLVVEGSLDERILARVIDKTHTVHSALDNRIKGG
jgi:SWI/SNF-related matrix-associated actin-dependent regulator 1 of chromatin subfamily A